MAHLAYYIYYRVGPNANAEALQSVRKAQTEIAAATGAEARLLTKRDEPDLWMEVYEGVFEAAAFEAELHAAVRSHELDRLLRAETFRKTEVFTDAPCA